MKTIKNQDAKDVSIQNVNNFQYMGGDAPQVTKLLTSADKINEVANRLAVYTLYDISTPGWYRIAKAVNNFSVVFTLNIDMPWIYAGTGSHRSVIQCGRAALQIHNIFKDVRVTKIRVLSKDVLDWNYIEVYLQPITTDTFYFSIERSMDADLSDFIYPSIQPIPDGYTIANEYNLI